MKIEHIAIWTRDLETMRDFYCRYFEATAGEVYINPQKQFASYFLSFRDGARLELMQMAGIPELPRSIEAQHLGLIHFAMAVGREEDVDALTQRLQADGYTVLDGPRHTGDGYYESVVLDPEQTGLKLRRDKKYFFFTPLPIASVPLVMAIRRPPACIHIPALPA